MKKRKSMKKWWKDPEKRKLVGLKISQSLRIQRAGLKNGTLSHQIGMLYEYRLWKLAVLDRCKYICSGCGFKSSKRKKRKGLDVHHINRLLDIIQEFGLKTTGDAIKCKKLWDTKNGTALCRKCHKILHPEVSVLV